MLSALPQANANSGWTKTKEDNVIGKKSNLRWLVLLPVAAIVWACAPIADTPSNPAPSIANLRTAITVAAPDSQDRFRRLISALVAQHPGTRTEFIFTPSPDALDMLERGEVDIVIPFAAPSEGNTSPVRLSSSSVMKGYVILYTNREHPLDPDALNGKRIEASASLAASLAFPTMLSSGPVDSLTRLNDKQIDGFISAEGVADAALMRLGFKSIHRHLYRVISGYVAIGDGAQSVAVDNFLTVAVERAQGNGDPDFAMMQERTYGEWQTYLPSPADGEVSD